MIHRFGDFELDEKRRELRLSGRDLVLQPLVFDLLLYLVKHRDRMVPKEELLQAVWADALVVDGALHRAVSLARSALRQGRMDEAIRTHARMGYRFCAELVDDPGAAAEMPEALERARGAFETGRWEEARIAFAEADEGVGLDAADLERWGMACQFVGRTVDALARFERAVAGHAGAGDRCGAARAALQISNLELERREPAIALGWRNRAASLLERQDESREHGFLAWLSCRLAIFAGDMDEAQAQAGRALDVARRLEDPELEALALNYQALTLVAIGDMARGVPLQDEAAAAALSGQVGPWAGGMIFCAVIWGCVNRGDWLRASQWSDHFTRWVDRHGVAPFPGLCRLHRAEILTLRGQLDEAERELLALRDVLRSSAPYAEGDLYRVLGDLRLARGDLAGADEAFRRAYELGSDPQPGRALLQVRQGKAAQALRSLDHSLKDPGWATRQRRGTLLAHMVIAAVAAGDEARARAAMRELEQNPTLWDTQALQAQVARARAELDFSQGRRSEAIAGCRHALHLWQEVGSPLAVASLHIRLAELLSADGDADTAEMEVAAAERLFRGIGLDPGKIRKG